MSVNKVILVGNVGKDPDIHYFEQDLAVARFPLATTDRAHKTKTGKEIPEHTEWHNIAVWRGLAKLAESYIRKGTPLYIEGKLRTRAWSDQNGQTHYVTEIVAENIELLGKKPDGGTPALNKKEEPNPELPQDKVSDAPPEVEDDQLPF
jgi:single-strand DNA-binding protein